MDRHIRERKYDLIRSKKEARKLADILQSGLNVSAISRHFEKQDNHGIGIESISVMDTHQRYAQVTCTECICEPVFDPIQNKCIYFKISLQNHRTYHISSEQF